MKKIISDIWNWLCTHKDWAHFIGGIGFGIAGGYDAAAAAAVTAEVKDKQWGGEPSMRDFLITLAGGLIGGTIHYMIFKRL